MLLKAKQYNSAIDTFAVGAMMAELYMRKPLFPGNSQADQLNKICQVLGTPSRMDWPEGYKLADDCKFKFPQCKPISLKSLVPNASEDALALMADMLCWDAKKRPSDSKCLNYAFFRCTLPIPLPLQISDKEGAETSKQSLQQMNNEHIKYITEEKVEQKQEQNMLSILLNSRYKPGVYTNKNI